MNPKLYLKNDGMKVSNVAGTVLLTAIDFGKLVFFHLSVKELF